MLLMRVFILLFLSTSARSEVPYVFSDGTQASAPQVNANFAAVMDRIETLELEIAELRSVSVVGHTYKLEISTTAVSRFDSDPQNAASDPGFWNIDLYVEKYTLTFNADAQQTATLQVDYDEGGDLWQDGSLRFSDEGNTDEDRDVGTLVLYWSQTGTSISLSETMGGESILNMRVTDGASALYGIDAEQKRNHDTGSDSCGNGSQRCYGDEFESSILIGTRM